MALTYGEQLNGLRERREGRDVTIQEQWGAQGPSTRHRVSAPEVAT